MRYGGFRVGAALVLIGLVAFLTGGAYAAGYAEGANHVGTVSPWVYGGFGASHLIGFIVTIFVLVLILRLVFAGAIGHRRHGWGYGPWSHGPGNTDPSEWQRGPWHDPRRAMLDDWHRQAHGAPGATGAPGAPSDPGQPGPNPWGGPTGPNPGNPGGPASPNPQG